MKYFLSLLVILCLSCKKETSRFTKAQLTSSTIDSLKFTSGIGAIFQDRNGNYWIGSHQEGLARFDGKFFKYISVNDGLADNQIRSIQQDSKGNIWIATANAISRYDGKNITTHPQPVKDEEHHPWQKTTHDLWFHAGNRAGVIRYDGQHLNYLAFPLSPNIQFDKTYHVTGFATGKNNMLWMGTYAGVFGYNGRNFSIIDDKSLGLTKENGTLHIRSLLEDSKGRLWMGNNGIGVLLKEGDSIINFSKKHKLIHPESSKKGDPSPPGTLEHVFAIEEDSEGNIWFGDRDTGAWKYNGKSLKNYTIDKKLSSPMVWCIYKDDHHNLLFGTAHGNIYQFDGKSFHKLF
ncbi:ligand-binding sensor domain-containing protein [Mesonia aquimarina]|uniref:ligand-binding sensor domain-containing protein n=1 Tax=Mesonia aquimarina TaxID=1504967 RepID=UPI000EF5F480|nr:two-component regulator propeller domain-containing protein [Mesonia aquimarina]